MIIYDKKIEIIAFPVSIAKFLRTPILNNIWATSVTSLSRKRNNNMYQHNRNTKKYLILSDQTESSLPEKFCKKGIVKNVAKFSGKHPCQGLFFSKVTG